MTPTTTAELRTSIGQGVKQLGHSDRLGNHEGSAFDAWFGDSKVVDTNGQPLVVYHGTPGFGQDEATGIAVFELSKMGKIGGGIYLTNSAGVAGYHAGARGYQDGAGAVYPVYAKIESPLTTESLKQHAEGMVAAVENAGGRANAVVEALYGWPAFRTTREERHGMRVSGTVDSLFAVVRTGYANGLEEYIRDNFDGVIWRSDNGDTEFVAFDPTQIKSAIGNNGQFDATNPDIRFSFAGESAATADRFTLASAQERLAAGEAPESVRQSTGWHRGVDGRWRFEIDDSGAALKPAMKTLRTGALTERDISSVTWRKLTDGTYDLCLNPPSPQTTADFVHLTAVDHAVVRAVLPEDVLEQIGHDKGEEDWISNFQDAKRIAADFRFGGLNALPLEHVLEHPALFAAYPALRHLMVQVDPALRNGGSYVMMVNGQHVLRTGIGQQLQTMLHEIQHGIQFIEGFAAGGTVESAASIGDKLQDVEIEAAHERFLEQEARSPRTFRAYQDLQHQFQVALANHAISAFDASGRPVRLIDQARALAKVCTPGERANRSRLQQIYNEAVEEELGGFVSEAFKQWSDVLQALTDARKPSAHSPLDIYRRLAGEVEARNVQARHKLTPTERQTTPPAATADVPNAEQILISDLSSANREDLQDPPSIEIENHDRWSIYQERSVQVGDGYVRWVEDPDTAYVIDIQAGPNKRGRALLEWLKQSTGKALHAVGVVDDAKEFWDRMEEDGLIDGQSDEDFMTFFGRAPATRSVTASSRKPTESPEFLAWFGASKVVDDNGQPLAVFRGDREDLTIFDRKGRREPGLFLAAESERATFYTASYRTHGHGVPKALYAKIERPLDLRDPYEVWRRGGVEKDIIQDIHDEYQAEIDHPDTGQPHTIGDTLDALENGNLWRLDGVGGFHMDAWRALQRRAEANGFDGLILWDDGEGVGRGLDYVVFDPNQVKSATDNNGEFDGTNPDIRFSEPDLTKSSAFRKWFSDSKVVDAEGKALVVYHGSPDARFMSDGATFRNRWTGETKGAHWFTESRKTAETYADPRRAFDYRNAEPTVIPAYLSMQNPFEVDAGGTLWRVAQKRGRTSDVIRQAQEGGHDGVIIRNVRDDYNNHQWTAPTDTYVVFESSQIKSATDNIGQFDSSNPDIRFSFADDAPPLQAESGELKPTGNVTDTPAFKSWFADSNLVDHQTGQPMLLYHGTNRDITTFKPSKIGFTGPGAYLSPDPEVAGAYDGDGKGGQHIMPVYARGKFMGLHQWSSYVQDAGGHWEAARQTATRDGFGGIWDQQYEDAVNVWEPDGNIKSAIGNNGAFDHRSSDIRFSIAEKVTSHSRPRVWCSALADGVNGIKVTSAPASGWLASIKGLVKRGTVKAAEVEWSGLNEWLAIQDGKIRKDQVLGFLEANGVQVDEVTLSGDSQYRDANGKRVFDDDTGDYIQAKSPAKYANYQLPGGTNYREVLLTLPGETSDQRLARWKSKYPDWKEGQNYKTVMTEVDQRRFESELESSKKDYRSGHWDQPNVLAHIRVNDRFDAKGRRVLFVEEIQSDWGQEGKKNGFAVPPMEGVVRIQDGYDAKKTDGWEAEGGPAETWAVYWADGTYSGGYETEDEAEHRLKSAAQTKAGGAPSAPFVQKTEGWLNLALKRVIKIAVDGGYDKVAFINGAQSTDRYDLSKQIDTVAAHKNSDGTYYIQAERDGQFIREDAKLPVSKLETSLGRDLAAKIIAGYGKEEMRDGAPFKIFSGLDLKHGGNGMKVFYDDIVPNAVNALLKKLGGDPLEPVAMVGVSKYERAFPSEAAAESWANEHLGDHDFTIRGLSESVGTYGVYDEFDHVPIPDDSVLTQTGFTVTPALRALAADGLPMFSYSDQAEAPGTRLAGMYSALAHELSIVNTRSAPAAGWEQAITNLVRNGRVKDDEVHWSGVKEWLALQEDRVAKGQVLGFLSTNGVQVTETVLSGAPETKGYRVVDPYGHTVDQAEDRDEALDLAAALQLQDGMLYQIEEDDEPEQAAGATQYSDHVLPGGANYREVLLTLAQRKIQLEPLRDLQSEGWSVTVTNHNQWTGQQDYEVRNQTGKLVGSRYGAPISMSAQDALVDHAQRLQLHQQQEAKRRVTFSSSHWSQQDVIAHIRVDDRVDADGKKVLMIQEIQSDWGQSGRRDGFQVDTDQPMVAVKHGEGDQYYWQVDTVAGHFVTNVTNADGPVTEAEAIAEARRRLSLEPGRVAIGVPRAPFVEKTDAWVTLAIKRIITMAVDEGYDKVAFVNGQQSVARFSLDQKVGKIVWNEKRGTLSAYSPSTDHTSDVQVINRTGVRAKELPHYIGKDLAKRLTEQGTEFGFRTLSGLDQTVGSDGMVAFYDKIVPNTLKRLLSKVGGAQLEQIQIGQPREARSDYSIKARATGGYVARVGEEAANFSDWNVANDWLNDRLGSQQIGFTITDQLRQIIVNKGLPLFSQTDTTSSQATPASMRAAIAGVIGKTAPSLPRGFGTTHVVTSDEIDPRWQPIVGHEVFASLEHADESLAGHRPFQAMLAQHRSSVQRAIKTIGDVSEAAIIKHESDEKWLMVLRDASETGKWRVQRLSPQGIGGHTSFATMDLCIAYAVKSGYVKRDDGALDRLQATHDFQRGMLVTDLRDQHRRSQLTLAEANAKLANFDQLSSVVNTVSRRKAQAFYDPSIDTMVFVADRIRAGSERSVYLHEVVHKHGRSALPAQTWNAMVNGVKGWANAAPGSTERAIYDEATRRSIASGEKGEVRDEELFAYAVEAAVNRGIVPSAMAAEGSAEKWLATVVANLQEIGSKLVNNNLAELTAQEVVDLAYALAQMESPERRESIREALGKEMGEFLAQLNRSTRDPDPMQETSPIDPPKTVPDLQQDLARTESRFRDLIARGVRHGPLWDQVRRDAAIIRGQLFDLTGDWYGKPKVKAIAPPDEALQATYDYPWDIPADVLRWVTTHAGLITSDATDAVRWSRIVDTERDDRYACGDLTIWRAVDASVGDDAEIRPGDWVTTDRKYAQQHLEKSLGGKGQIIGMVTDGTEVLVSPTGNDEEAIYAPMEYSGPVTRDFAGANDSDAAPVKQPRDRG